jgi:small-conductance mechanosensitive channel
MQEVSTAAAQGGVPERAQRAIDWVVGVDRLELAWSLAVVAVALVVARVLVSVVARALRRWAARTDTKADDLVARHLEQPLRWLLPFVALRLAMPLLAAPPRLAAFLHHTLLVAIVASSGWAVHRSLLVFEGLVESRFDVAARDSMRARGALTQIRTLRNVGSFVVVVLTIAFALMTFDTVRQLGAGLLASAGIAGIVIGFAAQRTIATVLAGVQIALTQPIRVEDVVIVEGEWGTIEEITLTYVVVKVWDLRRLVVPITYFLEKPFQNWTRSSTDLLGTVELRLDFSVPLDALREELRRIVEASTKWDGKVCGVSVTEASDRSMLVRPLVSAKDSGDLWDLRCEVREKLVAFVLARYPDALPRLRADARTEAAPPLAA